MNTPILLSNYTGLFGRSVHRTYTIAWAQDAGFTQSQATRIGSANWGVDFGVEMTLSTSPANPWHDTSWHMGIVGPNDARLAHANRMLDAAVAHWNQSYIDRDDDLAGLASLRVGSREYKRKMSRIEARFEAVQSLALRHLGRGLHALQDIHAHGNATGGFRGTHTRQHDDIRYDWADDTMTTVVRSGKTHGQRFQDTRNTTMVFFDLFISRIGGSL